jgi:hypothetical protein
MPSPTPSPRFFFPSPFAPPRLCGWFRSATAAEPQISTYQTTTNGNSMSHNVAECPRSQSTHIFPLQLSIPQAFMSNMQNEPTEAPRVQCPAHPSSPNKAAPTPRSCVWPSFGLVLASFACGAQTGAFAHAPGPPLRQDVQSRYCTLAPQTPISPTAGLSGQSSEDAL